MHIHRPKRPEFAAGMRSVAVVCFAVLAACAPLLGYPKDPEDTDATLTRLVPYFDGTEEVRYLGLPEPARTLKRNEIILARLRAYDIAFADFERRIYGDANAVSLGSDLVGLILGGLTATTGNAATKSALGAAATGVLGANTAITKDLYYQKTVPALLAQMEADRLAAKAPILAGLKVPDAEYPLQQAYVDLDAYKNAGSIPGAINVINQQAADAKDVAQAAIAIQRPSARSQLQGILSVRPRLAALATDAQFVALATIMQPLLATRSEQVQKLVKMIDPNNLRLSGNAKKARQVINAWINEDDVSPANQQQWVNAIAAAAAQ